jgi:hypothetical protein
MRYIITESQYKLLSEDLSVEVRRRFPFQNLKNDMEWGILDEMSPCDFDNIGEFVASACDELMEMYSIYFINEFDKVISPKDSDSLYYYLVDKFGDYLVKYYKNKCA